MKQNISYALERTVEWWINANSKLLSALRKRGERTVILWGRSYYPHWTEEEKEARKAEVTSQRSHGHDGSVLLALQT